MSDVREMQRPGTDPTAQERADWLKRVLGVNVLLGSERKPVRFLPPPTRPEAIDAPPLIGASRVGKGRKPAKLPLVTGEPLEIEVSGTRKVAIIRSPDGRVAFKAPPPPVGELTFSGGGGKGAALPGAAKALFPIMKDVTVVKGASVGSLTASLMAAGIDPDTFKQVGDSERTTQRILEGRSQGGKMALLRGLTGNPLTGEGLYSVVREEMNKAAGKHIDALWDKLPQELAGRLDAPNGDTESDDDPSGIDGVSVGLLRQVNAIRQKIAKGEAGLTFRDLATLHKAIPEIKEVEISATLMGDDVGEGGLVEGKRQLAMFNADTQPDMEVAKAAQASAALPPVFAPVEIALAGGMKGKFMDGGVMNNAPSSQTVQAQRKVDPIPTSGSLTYTFQSDDDSEDEAMLSGRPKPGSRGMIDKKLKAELTASDYGKNRLLADTPDDIVIVPLKFDVVDGNGRPVKTWYGKQKKEDFSTLLGGTINFNISQQNKDKLQQLTATATEQHLEKRAQPKTNEFASVKQMLNCIGADDLDGLVKAGFEGAREEQAFRSEALDKVKALIAIQGWDDKQLQQNDAAKLLEELEQLAGGDVDRLGFVARELCRSGRLDDFLKQAAERGGDGAPMVVQVGKAVADSFDAQAHAQNVLREVIYPRMTRKMTKSQQAVIGQVDDMLRAARSKDEVNEALDIVIDAFPPGKKPSTEALAFAQSCRDYKLA